MKRILCALIALFTFVGFQSNAQQIRVNIGSASGNIGDVVDVPVQVQLPAGSQGIIVCQGAIVSSDPSIASIISYTAPTLIPTNTNIVFAANILNPGAINFSGSSPQFPFNFANDLMFTLQVKINGPGCATFDLSELLSSSGPSSIEFLLDDINGPLFNDLATDFSVNTGNVCGGCLCDLSNTTLGPISFSQNPNDCLWYQVSVPAITTCSSVAMFEQYNYTVYDSNGNSVWDLTSNSNINSIIFPGNGVYSIVVTYILTEIQGGCTQTITHQEDFTVSGCGCSCDPSLLSIGAVTFQSTNDCSTKRVTVPEVTGCSSVEASHNYNFKFYSPSGALIDEVDGNLNGTPYDFNSLPFGVYTVVVTYTMTDDSGCDHELPPVSGTFNWIGCDACLVLGPPAFLNCQSGTNFQTLSWSPVAGASSYEVQMIFNDPACCSGSSGASTAWIFRPKGMSMNFSNQYCFSWRVRSVCDDGSKSAWSSSQCSCGTNIGTFVGSKKSMGQFEGEFEEVELQLTAVPNPATNHVDITFSGLSIDMTLNQPEVVIYDMAGKVVYQSEITLDETKRVDLNSFNSGIYIINITDNGSLLSTEKLIVE